MKTIHYMHVFRNLTLPKEQPNYGYLLYPSIEVAKEEAIKKAIENGNSEVRFEDTDGSKFIYNPRVRYKSLYGDYDCIIEIRPMEVFEQ